MRQGRQNEVFISYSRRDTSFVHRLDTALHDRGREAWIDWEDIPKAEDWREAIARGIAEADAFIFVISPDSIASDECSKELEQALHLQKRIIPLVWRDAPEVPPSLGAINWISCKETDAFDAAIDHLIAAMDKDRPHVELHTWLHGRAVYWEDKRDDSTLLRGQDLLRAEQWLQTATGKDPQPLPLHRHYIEQSRRVDDANMRLVRAGERARAIIGVSLAVALASVGITAWVVKKGTDTIAQQEATIARNQAELARQKQLTGKLTEDKKILTQQLLKFGFTQERVDALLAGSPEQIAREVEQVKQANASYHATLKDLGVTASSPPPSSASEGVSPEALPKVQPKDQPSPSPILTRSHPVVVEYYPKDVDPTAVETVLRKLAFEVKLSQPWEPDVPTNVIFYGSEVRSEDVKLVAYTLIRAGVEIKAIQPFTRLAVPKANVIQVAGLPTLKEKPKLEVETIRSRPLPLP